MDSGLEEEELASALGRPAQPATGLEELSEEEEMELLEAVAASWSARLKDGKVVNPEAIRIAVGEKSELSELRKNLVAAMQAFDRDVYVVKDEKIDWAGARLGTIALYLGREAVAAHPQDLLAAFQTQRFDLIPGIPPPVAAPEPPAPSPAAERPSPPVKPEPVVAPEPEPVPRQPKALDPRLVERELGVAARQALDGEFRQNQIHAYYPPGEGGVTVIQVDTSRTRRAFPGVVPVSSAKTIALLPQVPNPTSLKGRRRIQQARRYESRVDLKQHADRLQKLMETSPYRELHRLLPFDPSRFASKSPEEARRDWMDEMIRATRAVIEEELRLPDEEERSGRDRIAGWRRQYPDQWEGWVETARRLEERWLALALVLRDSQDFLDARGTRISAEEVRRILQDLAPALQGWGWFEENFRAYLERLPSEGKEASWGAQAVLIQAYEAARWRVLSSLFAQIPPEVMEASYYDLILLARLRILDSMEERWNRTREGPADADPLFSEIQELASQIGFLIQERLFTQMIREGVRLPDPKKPESLSRYASPAIGLLFLDHEGRLYGWVEGGAGVIPPDSASVRYPVWALQQNGWYRPQEHWVIGLAYPSISGIPSYESLYAFLEDRLLIRELYPEAEVRLVTATPEGAVRWHRPVPSAGEPEAVHRRAYRWIAQNAFAYRKVWRGLDERVLQPPSWMKDQAEGKKTSLTASVLQAMDLKAQYQKQQAWRIEKARGLAGEFKREWRMGYPEGPASRAMEYALSEFKAEVGGLPQVKDLPTFGRRVTLLTFRLFQAAAEWLTAPAATELFEVVPVEGFSRPKPIAPPEVAPAVQNRIRPGVAPPAPSIPTPLQPADLLAQARLSPSSEFQPGEWLEEFAASPAWLEFAQERLKAAGRVRMDHFRRKWRDWRRGKQLQAEETESRVRAVVETLSAAPTGDAAQVRAALAESHRPEIPGMTEAQPGRIQAARHDLIYRFAQRLLQEIRSHRETVAQLTEENALEPEGAFLAQAQEGVAFLKEFADLAGDLVPEAESAAAGLRQRIAGARKRIQAIRQVDPAANDRILESSQLSQEIARVLLADPRFGPFRANPKDKITLPLLEAASRGEKKLHKYKPGAVRVHAEEQMRKSAGIERRFYSVLAKLADLAAGLEEAEQARRVAAEVVAGKLQGRIQSALAEAENEIPLSEAGLEEERYLREAARYSL